MTTTPKAGSAASLDLAALEQLASAATPGPWMRLFGERTVYDRMEDGCRGNAIVRADWPFTAHDTHNLDFVAAANPTTVLELIAMARTAQPDPSYDEFLSKRLARVAKAAGVTMPDMTDKGIVAVAGTILGDIAYRLEKAATQQLNKKETHDAPQTESVLGQAVGAGPGNDGRGMVGRPVLAPGQGGDTTGIAYEADEGTVSARRFGDLIWHAHIYTNDESIDDVEVAKEIVDRLAATTQASTAQAKPGEWTDAQREAARDALSAELGGAMDCTRVWSAWGVGTMSEDDFHLLADNDERLDDLVGVVEAAILAATSSTDAQAAAEVRELIRLRTIVEVSSKFDMTSMATITENEASRRILALRSAGDTGGAA